MSRDLDSYSLLHDVILKSPQLIQAAQDLVGAASPNPPGDVSAAANVSVELLQRLVWGVNIKKYETAPGIVNVVACLRTLRPGRRLVFSGHLDTYPAGDIPSWTVPPYAGTLSEDQTRLYGRGVSDMKGGIAASIMAMSVLSRKSELWSGEIVLALAGDEETMGQLGSNYLLENVEAVRGDAMVCGDAGSPRVVRVGEKGLVWLEIAAKGRSAHGAHVHRGENAIDRLREALDVVKRVESIPLNPPQEVTDTINSAKPVSEPLSGDGEADVLGKITANIGTISGGSAPNLVASSARATVDIRIPVGTSKAEIINYVRQSLEPIEGVSFTVLQSYDPSWTSPDTEIVRHALDATRRVTGQDVVANMRVGASDSRLFRATGIPSVVVGLTPYNMGAADEYVMVEELRNVAQAHTLIAYEYLRPR